MIQAQEIQNFALSQLNTQYLETAAIGRYSQKHLMILIKINGSFTVQTAWQSSTDYTLLKEVI